MRLRKRIHRSVPRGWYRGRQRGSGRTVRVTPTVYEVAERAGVSTATVSRVLAGNERVLPPTRDKVLTAVAELGYLPSGAAKDLAARRTGVLGLCFPDLVGDQDIVESDATYWYDEVIRGMERAARRPRAGGRNRTMPSGWALSPPPAAAAPPPAFSRGAGRPAPWSAPMTRPPSGP